MTVTEALEICANARKGGTINFTPEQRTVWTQAKEIVHEHRMATDRQYARIYRDCYNRAAVGIGRSDLVGKHG